MLERREQRFDDEDVVVPSASYLSAAKQYAPLILLFTVVIGITTTGVVTLGMLPGHGPPAPPDAPGESETAAGLEFEDVEHQVHDHLEAEREQRDVGSRSYDTELASLATHLNRNEVRSAHGDEPTGEIRPEEFGLSCSRTITVFPLVLAGDVGIDAYEDESELAETIETTLRLDRALERELFATHSEEALDVHVGPEGSVYVLYATC
ncbi:hypothetical protein AB7C87_11935 [Natrarchaeobius sp. A-rgal3]|uniref:hypothetical protein n=1 Tax=Natrarchaeobius versutus TaxID=1679078 RepID=UPI0035101578